MLTFAPDVKQMIVGNLPEQTLQWLSMLIKISICVALCFTYPVQMFPVFEIFENVNSAALFIARVFVADRIFAIASRTTRQALLDAQSAHLEMRRNALRFAFVVLTLVVAATVPHFALFISLIGNLGSSMLMFVLPVRVCFLVLSSNVRSTK